MKPRSIAIALALCVPLVSTSNAQPIPKGDFNSDARRPEITVKDYREYVAGQPAERTGIGSALAMPGLWCPIMSVPLG